MSMALGLGFLDHLTMILGIDKNIGKEMILTAGPSIGSREKVFALDAANNGWNNQWNKYLNEFERIRYQRVSADKHDPNDTIIPIGLAKNVESRNPSRRGYAPDPFYVSHGKVKDSIELDLLRKINEVLDYCYDEDYLYWEDWSY